MVERIIEFSARNRFLVLLMTGVAVLFAVWAMRNIPLDAIPDLSDTQVIVYSRWDRSPDIIEDQVTYPIISALLGAPIVGILTAPKRTAPAASGELGRATTRSLTISFQGRPVAIACSR